MSEFYLPNTSRFASNILGYPLSYWCPFYPSPSPTFRHYSHRPSPPHQTPISHPSRPLSLTGTPPVATLESPTTVVGSKVKRLTRRVVDIAPNVPWLFREITAARTNGVKNIIKKMWFTTITSAWMDVSFALYLSSHHEKAQLQGQTFRSYAEYSLLNVLPWLMISVGLKGIIMAV